MPLFNKDEPIDVMVYTDGRIHISTPGPATASQRVLLKLFERGLDKGEFDVTQPGRYLFMFTKINPLKIEAELFEIVE